MFKIIILSKTSTSHYDIIHIIRYRASLSVKIFHIYDMTRKHLTFIRCNILIFLNTKLKLCKLEKIQNPYTWLKENDWAAFDEVPCIHYKIYIPNYYIIIMCALCINNNTNSIRTM